MGYINTFRGGMCIAGVYLCKNKRIAPTENGKEYGNLVTQNKIGTVDAKVRDSDSPGVGESETMDYVHVETGVTPFQDFFQLDVHRIRRAQEKEYVEADCLPVSKKDIKKMYEESLGYIRSVKNPYLQKLLCGYLVENTTFAKTFQFHSAAKTVHHGFAGDLLEHALSATRLYDYYVGCYLMISCDLLLTAAIFHDIGKTRELLRFPKNDYADNGQLLGHIIIGTEVVGESIHSIPGFLEELAMELKYCILAYHGELEYGSSKKPVLLEALVPNFADNAGTRIETMVEALRSGGNNKRWLGYNRLLESNIGKTTE